MLTKIGGLARAIAIILAIVAAFVALNMFNVPLALVVLGLIAGVALTDERMVVNVALVIALPIVGAALTHIPAIGAQLNAVALNLQLAMAGAVATAVAIRMYHLTMGGVMGLAGNGTVATPAAATH
jgi:prepilin signal peptidase PulO-like enzyme (type II secretory pathway)